MEDILLEVKNAVRIYKKNGKELRALDDVNLTLKRGEFLGIVGESGSGKSTILRHIACLDKLTSGNIYFKGEEYTGSKPQKLCRKMQMVFQDPVGSFDPRLKMKDVFKEIYSIMPDGDKEQKIKELMGNMGLPESLLEKKSGNISGGQCQRMAIVRAMAVDPEILLCDEATSALDVSAQAVIVKHLDNLKKRGISMIFVSHDLALTSSLCDRIMVFKRGKCVEEGEARSVIDNPKEGYTKQLLSSVLSLGNAKQTEDN